jgi:hypothetical protein
MRKRQRADFSLLNCQRYGKEPRKPALSTEFSVSFHKAAKAESRGSQQANLEEPQERSHRDQERHKG